MKTYLTTKDVAARLSVSEKTINRWRYECGLPYVRIEGSIRFDADAVERWLNKQQERVS